MTTLLPLLVLMQAGLPDRAWLASDERLRFTVVEESRPGYGATFTRTSVHLDAEGRGTVTAGKVRAARAAPLKDFLKLLATVAPGKAAAKIVLQRSDTYEFVEVRVRSGDGLRELVFFTASTDRTPVEWRLRLSPDQSVELASEELDQAWRALRAKW